MNFEIMLKITTAFLILLGFYIAGIFFKKTGYKVFTRWAKSTKWHADNTLLPTLRNHAFVWFILVGMYFSSSIILRQNAASNMNKLLLICFLISLTFLLSRFVSSLIKLYSEQVKTTVAMSDLTQSIARSLIFILGFLMILNTLGIAITPLLTTLGIGGLAVALALQDTLGNFFAGFHIIVTKQIRIADFISLDNETKGFVADINWRSTKISTTAGNTILVPNSKLAQSIITNYSLPQRDLALALSLRVHYDSNLDEVEKCTLETAREIQSTIDEAVSSFEPVVIFNAFGEHGIDLTVVLRAKEFAVQDKLKHEFIKRLHKKYKEKGIIIPYPVSALNLAQEQADKYLKK